MCSLTEPGCQRARRRRVRAVERAQGALSLRAALHILGLSPSRYHRWKQAQQPCTLDDQASCPRTTPTRLTADEVLAIKEMVEAAQYRHVPTGRLAILAQRLGRVFASPATWYKLVRERAWRRPRARVHPAKPKDGVRARMPDELWHVDTTVIRLLDGTKVFLHAVIDNFSRRILAWRVTDSFAVATTVAILRGAVQGAVTRDESPTLVADAGVENVNSGVDGLIESGLLCRVLALKDVTFSNSMIEAWWRTLKHQWQGVMARGRAAQRQDCQAPDRSAPSRLLRLPRAALRSAVERAQQATRHPMARLATQMGQMYRPARRSPAGSDHR